MKTTHRIPGNEFLAPIRKHLGNCSIRVPSAVSWEVHRSDDGAYTICAALTTEQLSQNMQGDVPSFPIFALCLAYWHEHLGRKPTRCRIDVIGPCPTKGLPLLHWRRSLFILTELEALLGQRIACQLPDQWHWPHAPHLNHELRPRDTHDAGARGEHALELKIVREDSFRKSMQLIYPGFLQFNRQLPVGLFDGPPGRDGRWTPAGKSQIDLWGQSDDANTLHLFELKDGGNQKVGILTEAFYYARLLHYVRVGPPGSARIMGTGIGVEATRRAKCIVMWLTAYDFHPLIVGRDRSPLNWLNDALIAQGLQFRVLRIARDHGRFDPCSASLGVPEPSTVEPLHQPLHKVDLRITSAISRT